MAWSGKSEPFRPRPTTVQGSQPVNIAVRRYQADPGSGRMTAAVRQAGSKWPPSFESIGRDKSNTNIFSRKTDVYFDRFNEGTSIMPSGRTMLSRLASLFRKGELVIACTM